MNARDLMTPDPRVVTLDESVVRAAATMRECDIGALPVVNDRDERRLVGILTDRDITTRHVAAGHESPCGVWEHMSVAPLATVRPEDDVSVVERVMREARVRRVVVTDRWERVVGIVAQADLVRHVGPGAPNEVEAVLEHLSTSRNLPAGPIHPSSHPEEAFP